MKKKLYIIITLLIAMVIALILFSPKDEEFRPVSGELHMIFAGVPKPLGEEKKYDSILNLLSSNGVNGFFPTSQYQEAPLKALGYELDFFPPCTSDSPAYAS